MDIYEFCNLCSDDSAIVAVWDYTTEEEVFCGELRDAADKYGEYEIEGLDILSAPDSRGVTLILNISTEEEEEYDA